MEAASACVHDDLRDVDTQAPTSPVEDAGADNESTCAVMAESTLASCISIPHLSYATDLLFSIDDVRASCTQGLTTQQCLITLLKSRIALERQYASELTKMATQSHLEELEHGTMRDALGHLKAQYMNTSVQHRILAKNLEEDVLKPIETLYNYNAQKAQNLHKLMNNIKKQAKAHEDVYKKDYAVFDKHFRDASMAFAVAMDAGFSSTLIEQQYHRQLAQIPVDGSIRKRSLKSEQAPVNHMRVEGANGENRPRQKSVIAMQSLNSNSHKLVNWLLSSEQQRKDGLCTNAVKALESAEAARRRCQVSWEGVEQSRIDMYRAFQSVLTEYQQITEHRISNLATNLRKHVVFESSALANEQYDWQMIAGKIENVDFEGDIREFILKHQSQPLPELTVNDLCNNVCGTSFVASPTAVKSYRPLKKAPLQIHDLALRKIPFDHEGNQEPLPEVLVTRSCCSTKNFLDRCDRSDEREDFPDPSIRVGPCDYDNLRVDCSESIQEKIEDPVCRVSLAQDVARAIARAYELRAVQKSLDQDLELLDLDNNSHDPPVDESKSPTSMDGLENNHLDDGDTIRRRRSITTISESHSSDD